MDSISRGKRFKSRTLLTHCSKMYKRSITGDFMLFVRLYIFRVFADSHDFCSCFSRGSDLDMAFANIKTSMKKLRVHRKHNFLKQGFMLMITNPNIWMTR